MTPADLIEIDAYRGPGTTVLDAGGNTVPPGIHDAHFHLSMGANGIEGALYPNRPVALFSIDFHTVWANTEALAAFTRGAAWAEHAEHVKGRGSPACDPGSRS